MRPATGSSSPSSSLDPLGDAHASGIDGLYVHVPFCQADCAYCAFAREVPPDRGAISDYVDALEAEVSHWLGAFGERLRPRTVFVGGGTPSYLNEPEWARFAAALERLVDRSRLFEVTIEANPESLGTDTLRRFSDFGITRLSIGAQSTHGAMLSLLGRTHAWEGVVAAFERARGVENLVVNLDLIYGIPGLSAEMWAATVDGVLALGPDHLSAYCLSYEEGTSLTKRRGAGELNDQSDEVQRAAYDLVVARAAAAGLDRYEVSNFGTARSRCRHNLLYWKRGTFLGLGPSAHSAVGGRRFWNHTRRDRWAAALAAGEGPVRGVEAVDGKRLSAEILMQLRISEGVPRSQLPREVENPVLWRRIGDFVEEGLVVVEPEHVRLDDGAYFVSDGVTAELMAAWDAGGT